MKKEADRFVPSTLFEGMVSLRVLLSSRKREIKKVLIDGEKAKKRAKELSYLKAMSYEIGYEIEYLPHDTFEAMMTGNSHGGIAALCGKRDIPPLTSERIPQQGFCVMLDGIEDPYNFGYALRSLYAAGVYAVILPERNWMSAAGLVCRASAGASELTELFLAPPEQAADLFHKTGYRVVAADLDNSIPVYESDMKKPLLLIVGGEKRGISAAVRAKCDLSVRLDYGRDCPFALSAASAASILAFEVMRQNNSFNR